MPPRTRGGLGGAANNVELHNATSVAVSGYVEVPNVFCANKPFTLLPGAAQRIENNCEPSRVVIESPTKDIFAIPPPKHHPGKPAMMILQRQLDQFVMRTDIGIVTAYVPPAQPTNDILLQNKLPVAVSGYVYVSDCTNEQFSLAPGQQHYLSQKPPCMPLQIVVTAPIKMTFNVPKRRRQALVSLQDQAGRWVLQTDVGTEYGKL
jgi:hypothetical protein